MTIGTDLRGTITGRVVTAGDNGFDEARQAWNLAIDQPVAAVVEPASVDDITAIVRYAKNAGRTIVTQPSGHGASGDVEGAILLRTNQFDDLAVRPDQRTATVGAGVKWGEVLTAAGQYGLTGVAGSAPVVSVTGYTLGGGLSWFSRKHGFASNSVRALEIVDADGDQRTITGESDQDLFWALRGGSGDFAIVTAIEFELYSAPNLYGGRLMWPGDRAPEVLDAYRAVTAEAPEELTVWVNRLQVPGGPALVVVDSTYLGLADDGADLLRRFEKIDGRLDNTRRTLPLAELGTITAEPTDPSPGSSRTELLTELTDDGVAKLLAKPVDPLIGIQLRQLGGALATSTPTSGASGAVTEPHLLFAFGPPSPAVKDRQDELVRDLAPSTSGRKPYTFLASGETAAQAFDTDTLTRLREIKQDRDPHGVFRSNYPVLATAAP